MSFDLADVNWLAVLVAAIAYFVLGSIWFARPVFGRMWTEASGFEMTQDEGPNPAVYAVPFVGSLLSAVVLGILVEATRAEGVGDGIALGLAIAIGFAIPIIFVTAVFETSKPKPAVWALLNGGYHAVGNVAAAIILTVWM